MIFISTTLFWCWIPEAFLLYVVLYLTVFSLIHLFAISHDLHKRVVDKEQEKQKILEDTKELTEKNTKISKETENMNQELKNVEK